MPPAPSPESAGLAGSAAGEARRFDRPCHMGPAVPSTGVEIHLRTDVDSFRRAWHAADVLTQRAGLLVKDGEMVVPLVVARVQFQKPLDVAQQAVHGVI